MTPISKGTTTQSSPSTRSRTSSPPQNLCDQKANSRLEQLPIQCRPAMSQTSSLLTRFSQVHPQDCPNPKMPLGSPLNPAFPLPTCPPPPSSPTWTTLQTRHQLQRRRHLLRP